ncbi:hypothetical protein [Nonomuraea sp. NPDC050643]|uniref:hypothetical protein n=1 Tax=Nonomuraea sp. NPDC050643 TaxID=3155660 RepID=UPI0033F880C0
MADFSSDDSWYMLLSECLRLTHPPGRHELPVILLLGPPGTGKTAALGRIAAGVIEPPSPLVHLEFHPAAEGSVLARVQRLAHDLVVLRKVKLPRTVFTLLVLKLDPDLSDLEMEEQLQSILRGNRSDPPIDVGALGDMLSCIPTVGPFLKSAAATVQFVTRLRTAPDFLHDTARSWLTESVPGGNVVDLARDLSRRGRDRTDFVSGVLCDALLEDLAQAWSRHRYPRNCLLLLDDADTPAGDAFLRALIAARTRRTEPDPLVVVVASKVWPRALSHWTRPGILMPDANHPPTAGQARHADWLDRRGKGEHRWWYPVLLPALPADPLWGSYVTAVHELSRGYPAATRVLIELTEGVGDDDEFRRVLHEDDTLNRLLPERLPHRELLIAWSAVRNVDDAVDAPFSGQAPLLRDELADTLWLTDQGIEENETGVRPPPGTGGPRVTVLHGWLRRLLLHRLAADPSRWDAVHAAMEWFYLERGQADHVAAMYHRLACVTGEEPDDERLSEVVEFLAERFESLDRHDGENSRLRDWIKLYEQVTTAPNRLPLDRSLDLLYDSLATHSSDPERRARKSVIRALVVARWFWLDPLLDPAGRCTEELARQFRELATRCRTGRSTLLREADRYERRPTR